MRDESRMTAHEIANEQEWELAQAQQMSKVPQEEYENRMERGEELSL